jgi:predicted RNA-binding Zn ribbon-like protein
MSAATASAEPGGRTPARPPLRLVQAFINTNDREGGSDALGERSSAIAWLREAGFGFSRLGEEDRQRLVAFRECLRALALANNGVPLDERALPVLNMGVARSGVAVVFEATAVHLRPTRGRVDGVIARLAGAVFEAMAGGTWTRLKACRRDVCRWVFYDHSRNRSGTWCTMEVCGNRVKTSAYWRRRSGPV